LGDDGLFCKQQKNYNETEKWIVWAPGLMNIIVSSQKYEGEERSFGTRGETKKAHHHHHQKQQHQQQQHL